mgnify:FL=1
MKTVGSCFLSGEYEGLNCIITLLLTGRATPFLHNGVVYVGDEDHYVNTRTKTCELCKNDKNKNLYIYIYV